jgi:site-specific recombinase XerD
MLAKETKVSHYFGMMLERAGIIEATVYTVPEGERMNNRTIREKSFHSLRHTVLTELARTGADKQLRQLLADHEDPRVNDRYTHAEVERLAGALALAFPQ